MSDFILTDVTDGIARITLNRPKAINALTAEMMTAMYEALTQWHHDDDVTAVEIAGAGDRGFCAGADVRALSAVVAQGGSFLTFLETEYALDMLIANYPKPVTSFMRGITMGGGLGLGGHADRRIVYADTVMAMPETKIGFFPDVGMMLHLARARAVGRHVALTAATFTGGDALLLNLADESADGPLPAPLFEAAWIQECYESDDPVQIARMLESHPDEAAQQAARELRARSPFAVHVAMRALLRAERLGLSEVLDQDLRLAESVLTVDFVEGVRALLIDKDNNPQWRWKTLEEVPQEAVDAVFAYRSSWNY
ncbi:enoyl-CoA hydratase/isomerase family protein [Tessaracoccus sp. MC1865]|uniref:enoyl-CoA hydratase/isomerase family protein n=1 Tax=Tessaracoccus sp. MC1865 TaxID=2760310 RepID=UPI0015FF6937|nr:enoyl-CoA hydratase/isomerase family protein [Tessaracoccus sp. MC1865]MBB1483056.1 enoyl-CoA hydratase/isomerase family protein [Tessaracoccus sp. MC1865]QTO37513.1 enoyl-CoA hydratase/isomerase family protein [Tessaracoccus sp. MC1865]